MTLKVSKREICGKLKTEAVSINIIFSIFAQVSYTIISLGAGRLTEVYPEEPSNF